MPRARRASRTSRSKSSDVPASRVAPDCATASRGSRYGRPPATIPRPEKATRKRAFPSAGTRATSSWRARRMLLRVGASAWGPEPSMRRTWAGGKPACMVSAS